MKTDCLSGLTAVCNELRRDVFTITKHAKSGHTGGCSSSVELITALYLGGALHFDPQNPQHENRDRVLVRGHLGPLRYKLFSLMGWIPPEELTGYRSLHSRLEGHEDMFKIPGVDITPSGSLGMLLSYGVGAAINAQDTGRDFKTFVFLGDGEEQEGNIGEAARHAASLKLPNLITILDKNGKQLSRPTRHSDSAADIGKIWEGYGWDVREIKDGHNLTEISEAYAWARQPSMKPKFIIANTIKGKGIPGCDKHYSGYHTVNTARSQDLDAAILEHDRLTEGISVQPIVENALAAVPRPAPWVRRQSTTPNTLAPQKDKYNNLLEGLGECLKQLTGDFASRKENLYVVTPDLIREDVVSYLGLDGPTVRLLDVGIREQHATALAHGISVTDRESTVVLDIGEEFLYRNADQMNVLSQARSPVIVLGNMGGICGAKNGQTHQPSGQSGMLTLMPGIRCLEPADTEDLFMVFNEALAYRAGPTYIRMHSGPLPVMGQVKRNVSYYVSRAVENPEVTLLGNGLTMKGCCDAADLLKQEGIACQVINVINRGALDENFAAMLPANKPAITVYNGNPESLSYPVADAVMKYGTRPSRIVSHGFRFGKSGDLADLINYFGFDGQSIATLVRKSIS